MKVALAVVVVLVPSGCRRTCAEPTPAGLRAGSRFDVTLSASASSSVHPELEAAVSCGALDGLAVGGAVSITTGAFGGAEGACVLGGSVDVPMLTVIGGGVGTPVVSDVQFWSARRVDFGDGCAGVWELAVASAGSDAGGSVIGIRRFVPDLPDRCQTLIGAATSSCADYYFVSIAAAE